MGVVFCGFIVNELFSSFLFCLNSCRNGGRSGGGGERGGAAAGLSSTDSVSLLLLLLWRLRREALAFGERGIGDIGDRLSLWFFIAFLCEPFFVCFLHNNVG